MFEEFEIKGWRNFVPLLDSFIPFCSYLSSYNNSHVKGIILLLAAGTRQFVPFSRPRQRYMHFSDTLGSCNFISISVLRSLAFP